MDILWIAFRNILKTEHLVCISLYTICSSCFKELTLTVNFIIVTSLHVYRGVTKQYNGIFCTLMEHKFYCDVLTFDKNVLLNEEISLVRVDLLSF